LPAQTGLDFAWGLETTTAANTPSVSLVTVVISIPSGYQAALTGGLGSTQDIGMVRLTATTTALFNNTNAALTIQAALQVV